MTKSQIAAVWLGLMGCVVEDVETSEATEDLLGTVTTTSDCTAQKSTFITSTMRYGRITASTRAFEQCVEQALRAGVSVAGGGWAGNYRRCNGDPFYGEPLTTQLQAVLDVARSGYDVQINCSSPNGNASAGIGTYNQTSEALGFSTWLDAVVNQPRVGAWPTSQTAGIIWHEVMHQHGYTHGADDQANALVNCGYAGDPTWHFQVNTMPYIIGACMTGVLDESAAQCGDIDACPAGQVRLISSYGGRGCECVADPNGVTTRPGNAYLHVATASNTNTAAGVTVLDHPLLNGRSDALVQFTHVYNAPGQLGVYMGRREIAAYNPVNLRWQITSQGPMPVGTAYNIRVNRGVVHRTTAANVTQHITRIDHPLANGNPNVFLTVTPTGANLNPHAIGTWFDTTAGRWTIFNQDRSPMPLDATFTIEVETQTTRGLHGVHLVTTGNRSSHMTRLSNPFLDGRPNARLLVTPNWSRGMVYNTNQFGVWFDGSSWWIYNEGNGTSGNLMPLGAAFDIEILKDEVQRYIRVPESASSVDTGVDVAPLDRLHVHGTQRISPDFFGGNNGAGGTGVTSGWPFPLPTAGDFSLIGSFPDGLFPNGVDGWRNGPSSTQRLSLRVNDFWPGNGTGFFEATVRAFR
jgi:hypothetical protein